MATFSATLPDVLEPFVTEIFFNRLKMIPPRFPKIFNIESSGRAFEEHLRLAGLGTFQVKREGTAIPYDDPVQGTRVRTIFTVYALGFRVTMEMRDDDQHNIISKMPKDLADSARDHRERIAHDLINNSFSATTYTGLDGAALCATHTNLKTGTSQSNSITPAVALSVSGIQSALTNMRTTTNESDRFISLTPAMLLIPPELEFTAAELLKSDRKPYTADNEINTVATSRIGVTEFVSEFLTDDESWWLLAVKSQHTLTWWNRKSLATDNSMDSQTKDMLYDAMYRAAVAFYDWRGVVGSNV